MTPVGRILQSNVAGRAIPGYADATPGGTPSGQPVTAPIPIGDLPSSVETSSQQQSPTTKVFKASGFGVLANGKCVTDAAMTSGSNALSSASAAFTAADVGKLVTVNGAAAPITATLSAAFSPSNLESAQWTVATGKWLSLGAVFPASGGSISKVQEAVINSGGNGSATTATVTLSGVAAGDTLTLSLAMTNITAGPATVTVADNVNGSWTQVTAGLTNTNWQAQLWEFVASAAGSVTITITTNHAFSSTGLSAWAAEWANLGAASAMGSPTSGNSTTVVSPAVSGTGLHIATMLGGVVSAQPASPWTAEAGGTWFGTAGAEVAYGIGTSGSLLVNSTANAFPSGGITLSNGTNTQRLATPGAVASSTSIPIAAAAALYTFNSGATISTVNRPVQGWIGSVSGGVASLVTAPGGSTPLNAGVTVSGATCFYASDDTPGALACIAAAEAAGGTVEFPDAFVGLSAPLPPTGAIEIRGQSCKPLYGSFATSSGGAYSIPTIPPYLQGTVFWQFTPATDCLQLAAVGQAQDLHKLGILFPGLHFNTGHGVNVTAPGAYEGYPDQGTVDPDWDHVYVFGHDGSHYGFNAENVLLPRFAKLRSWGGGGMRFFQTSKPGGCGNITLEDCFAFVFNCGMAHALAIDDLSSALGGAPLDFSKFGRWQSWVANLPTFAGGNISGYTPPNTIGPTPNSQQMLVEASGTIATGDSGENGFVFDAVDLETNVNAQVSALAGLVIAAVTAGLPSNAYGPNT
jgi:hypothetical protein